MASLRDANPGRDPQRAGSLPEEPASTSQPRTVSMPEDLVASIERGRARPVCWPRDGREAMAALARLFPSMRGVSGADPWSVEDLIAWCNSGAPTSGSGWAARFLLAVWNPGTDWTEFGIPGRGKFDLMEAWSCWDDRHRAAVLEWLQAPFWP
jgi:hypothetical protein